MVCLKTGFCIGGLTRGFNLSSRKSFALLTAHITSYLGWSFGDRERSAWLLIFIGKDLRSVLEVSF
jgi:hypothetical protein